MERADANPLAEIQQRAAMMQKQMEAKEKAPEVKPIEQPKIPARPIPDVSSSKVPEAPPMPARPVVNNVTTSLKTAAKIPGMIKHLIFI